MDSPERAQANAVASGGTLSPAVKRSMVGGVISMFIDSFDVYLPAIVLPAAMTYFMPRTLGRDRMVTLTTVIFTVTLLARPFGGMVFGNFADKLGRKRVAMMTAAGFTVATFLMASMPGYVRWGYVAPGILIALRAAAGIFLGGGYAAPIPLALERSPKPLRGLVVGIIAAAAPTAMLVMNGSQVVVLHFVSAVEYALWGWRILFFFGGLLGLPISTTTLAYQNWTRYT